VSANLDLVRSIYAKWERGDFSSTEWADAGIEFAFLDGPEPGCWTGIAQMADVWRRVLSEFDGFGTEGARYLELEDGRIAALTRFHGRAKQSGLELSQMPSDQLAIFEVRDGRIVRIELAWDAAVLAHLGLED
jgi:ketosteroid isomerase-like protein